MSVIKVLALIWPNMFLVSMLSTSMASASWAKQQIDIICYLKSLSFPNA